MMDGASNAAPRISGLPALFDLSGRVALITGSSGGLGLTMARALCEAGASVILNGRDEARLAGARAELEEHGIVDQNVDTASLGQNICHRSANLGRLGDVEGRGSHGEAGIQHRTPLHEFPEDAFRRVIETNLTSAFLVGQAVVQGMIERREGTIINICSVQSELARPSIAPYAASKGGLKMLTKGMALDWGRYGIRVNGLAPGYFKTELNSALVSDEKFSTWLEQRTPLGRWGDTGELAGAAVFLASAASSFVTGHILYVDGGITSCL
ncbi:SDR family oxidoreductase [Ensifer sp. D2-11]